MNYAEIMNNPTSLDDVVKTSSSPFKPELTSIIEKTIVWLSQEPDFLDDDFINWTVQWLEKIGTKRFENLLNDYQVSISELVDGSNKKEGNFISIRTSELLDEEYVTAASAAICTFKLCLDMLKQNSTEHIVFTSIKVISSQVLWLDTILKTLMYSEWRNDKEAIGQNAQSQVNLYVESLAKDIWIEKKMTYVSSILISQLVVAQIKLMNGKFEKGEEQLIIEGLCDIEKQFEVDPYNDYQINDIHDSYSAQWNSKHGEKNWQLKINEQGDMYNLLTNKTVTRVLKDEAKLINNFKQHLTRTKLKGETPLKRKQAITSLEEYFPFNYCSENKEFIPKL